MNWFKLVNVLLLYGNITDSSVRHCEKSRQCGGNAGQLKKLHNVPLATGSVITDIRLQRTDFSAPKALIAMFLSTVTPTTYLQQRLVSLNHFARILSHFYLFNTVTSCGFQLFLQAGSHTDLRYDSKFLLFLTRTILKGVQPTHSDFLAVKRSEGVASEVNLRYLLRTGDEACKWRNLLWLWIPRQTSPEVQNRGISDPTKRTYILQKYFFYKKRLIFFLILNTTVALDSTFASSRQFFHHTTPDFWRPWNYDSWFPINQGNKSAYRCSSFTCNIIDACNIPIIAHPGKRRLPPLAAADLLPIDPGTTSGATSWWK